MKTITKVIVDCHNYAYYLKERYTISFVEAEFKDITDCFFLNTKLVQLYVCYRGHYSRLSLVLITRISHDEFNSILTKHSL